MTQFTTLSSESTILINRFMDSVKQTSKLKDHRKNLIVSLYALQNKANAKVLEILEEHRLNLTDYFDQNEIKVLQNEYSQVIRFCYHEQHIVTYKKDATSEIPQSLIDLCLAIADCKPGSEIFLPYAKESQFAFSNKSDCKYEGFESEESTWAFSQILLSSQNINSNITLGNVRYEDEKIDGSKQKKYDYIFSFPPFYNYSKEREVMHTLLFLAQHALKEDGEMYCILPLGRALVSRRWFEFRQLLNDEAQYSAFVMALPDIILPFTSLEVCLFSFKNDHKGHVILMDADQKEFVARHKVAGQDEFLLKEQSILESMTKYDEKYFWQGKVSQLVNDLDLNPKRYLITKYLPIPKEGEQLVALSDLIEMLATSYIKEKEVEQPSIKIKDLASNYLNCELHIHELSNEKNIRHSRSINQDCLLASFIGGHFKVAKIKGLNSYNEASLQHSIFSFNVKSDIITEDFLLRSILSDEVQEQARKMSAGMIMSRIHHQDFSSLKIIVPSLEQQELLYKQDTRASLTESDLKRLEFDDAFRKDMHMKKHALGQTLFNLNNWWTLLQKARKEGNGCIEESAEVGKIHKRTVNDIFENLDQTISKIQHQLNKFDTGYGMQVELIALTRFVESYIKDNPNPLFEYRYKKGEHYYVHSMPEIDIVNGKAISTGENIFTAGDPIENVYFAPEALKQIFDNIVSNACQHGFKGRENGNIIRIEIGQEGDDYFILMSNNGESMHNELSNEDVFTYGRTSQNNANHFGIGGYEIKKLMREFNGDAELIVNGDAEFPITYKLTFYDTDIEIIETLNL